MPKLKAKKGFTLVELLVVIAIIGFIASVAMYALNSARMESRDAQRLAGMETIKKALDLYYDDNKRYPVIQAYNYPVAGSPNNFCTQLWCKEGYSAATWTLEKYLEPYLPQLPREPLGNQQTVYRYFYKAIAGNDQVYGLAIALESPKYNSLESNDNGALPGWYEIGEMVQDCKKASTPVGAAWSGAISCP